MFTLPHWSSGEHRLAMQKARIVCFSLIFVSSLTGMFFAEYIPLPVATVAQSEIILFACNKGPFSLVMKHMR
jgi:hypothetical protein